jgi:hypothetical protein
MPFKLDHGRPIFFGRALALAPASFTVGTVTAPTNDTALYAEDVPLATGLSPRGRCVR